MADNPRNRSGGRGICSRYTLARIQDDANTALADAIQLTPCVADCDFVVCERRSILASDIGVARLDVPFARFD